MRESTGKLMTMAVMALLVVNRLGRTARQDDEDARPETLSEWLVTFASQLLPFAIWGLGIAYAVSSLPKPPSATHLLVAIAWFLIPFVAGNWLFNLVRVGHQSLAQPARTEQIQAGAQFYSSPEWQTLRASVIREEGKYCDDCGIRINRDQDITVDHVLPRNKHPELALRRDNLRVLCRSCSTAMA